MAWLWLGLAGCLEVVWAYYLKKSDGFADPVAGTISVVTMIASVGLLALAMRTLPLGTAYMIWTGIGAVGTFLAGVVLLGEPAGAARLVAAGLVVAGLVILKASHG